MSWKLSLVLFRLILHLFLLEKDDTPSCHTRGDVHLSSVSLYMHGMSLILSNSAHTGKTKTEQLFRKLVTKHLPVKPGLNTG